VIVVLAYLALLLLAAITIATRPEAMLVRGEVLLRVNLAFLVALAIAAIVAVELRPLAIGAAAAHAASWAYLRDRWILLKSERAATRQAIETAFARIRVPYTTDNESYVLTATPRTILRASRGASGARTLRFEGRWRENKPALARSLLAKGFRGVLPEPRIRIGGR
jgi:hypothetical protein